MSTKTYTNFNVNPSLYLTILLLEARLGYVSVLLVDHAESSDTLDYHRLTKLRNGLQRAIKRLRSVYSNNFAIVIDVAA